MLVYTLDAVLLLITATTLVAIALLSVRERVRDYGVLKTIGLTPRQIASSLVSAHAAVAPIAALAVDPRRHRASTSPSTASPAAAPKTASSPRGGGSRSSRSATVLLVAARHQPPARLATRIPTADALRYE